MASPMPEVEPVTRADLAFEHGKSPRMFWIAPYLGQRSDASFLHYHRQLTWRRQRVNFAASCQRSIRRERGATHCKTVSQRLNSGCDRGRHKPLHPAGHRYVLRVLKAAAAASRLSCRAAGRWRLSVGRLSGTARSGAGAGLGIGCLHRRHQRRVDRRQRAGAAAGAACEFWDRVTDRTIWPYTPDGDIYRQTRNTVSALTTAVRPARSVQAPQDQSLVPARPAQPATSFYDNSLLRETLEELVDFGSSTRVGRIFRSAPSMW